MRVRVPIKARGVKVFVSGEALVKNVKETPFRKAYEYPKRRNFKPKRMVVGLKLLKHTEVDLEVRVREGEKKMAYWFRRKWWVFGKKHDFRIEKGIAKAHLKGFGDPPIGMD
jgi:hypothetical protein